MLVGALTYAEVTNTFLEVAPSLHGDLATVEFSFILDAGLLSFFTVCLPRLSPREIVESAYVVSIESDLKTEQIQLTSNRRILEARSSIWVVRPDR